MKLIAALSFFLGAFFISSCTEAEPETVVKSIPAEDRFIFSPGDRLFYSCSDYTVDTVLVHDVEFYTDSYSEEDLLGRLWNFRVDHARISLEIRDASWLTLFHYACYNPEDCNQCVTIETDSFLEETPTTHVYFGCEHIGGLVFATGVTTFGPLTLNGQSFQKVYSWNQYYSDTEGFRMYWSLKYGIIRFEGEIGEMFHSWDLVIPGQ